MCGQCRAGEDRSEHNNSMPTSHVQSCTAERELRLDRRGPLSARKPSKSIGWQIYLRPIFRILPNNRRNIPFATLCFSTAAAAAPPLASHPRRPRPDAAALGGSERPRRRGRAADLCWGHGGRGQQQRPWPRLSGLFGSDYTLCFSTAAAAAAPSASHPRRPRPDGAA